MTLPCMEWYVVRGWQYPVAAQHLLIHYQSIPRKPCVTQNRWNQPTSNCYQQLMPLPRATDIYSISYKMYTQLCCVFLLVWLQYCSWRIQMIYLPIGYRIYDQPSASDVALMDMGKITYWPTMNKTKHKLYGYTYQCGMHCCHGFSNQSTLQGRHNGRDFVLWRKNH